MRVSTAAIRIQSTVDLYEPRKPPFRAKAHCIPRAVLIVEGNRLLAAQVEAWLEEEGFDVAGRADTVGAALALTESRRPRIALVDLNLGGALAHAVIAKLREQGARIVVMTGHSDAYEIAGDVVAVVRKPCTKSDVISAVRLAGRPN